MNHRWLSIAAFAIAALLPLGMGDYWLYLLAMTGAYGIVALGLNLLTGLSGQISLGHAGFFAIGAYASTILNTRYNLPFLLSGAIAVAIGWLVGFGVGFPAVRLRGLYLAIATMAFGIGVERILYHFKDLTGGPYGLTVMAPQFLGVTFNTPQTLYYLVLTVVAVSVLFIANVVHGRPGRMLVAMRDNELAASAMGVDVKRLKVMAFAVSASLATLGGVLYAPIITFISVEHFTLWLSITFVSMIIVGGLGSIVGSFLGAAFVVLVPELLRDLGGHHQIIYGLAMILVFVLWPSGLVGILNRLWDLIATRRGTPPPGSGAGGSNRLVPAAAQEKRE
ncbi:MAG: branched-chain amino acid ABC transporter permease [Ottowia sp.]|uniref:branched-chain amino acid ABC transporter permease n=1 Tax=Ottowia sp. TaxID=1898956 RepID=UPI0039E3733C